MRKLPKLPRLLVAFSLCATTGQHVRAQVGDITFETSGSSEAQRHFLRGVAILHSFGFEDAIDQFRKAQELDPDFALAYWGEAMALNQNLLASPTRPGPSGRASSSREARAHTCRAY